MARSKEAVIIEAAKKGSRLTPKKLAIMVGIFLTAGAMTYGASELGLFDGGSNPTPQTQQVDDPNANTDNLGTTDPGTTDPGTTDPGTTDPGTTDPGTTDPGTTDPGTTEPEPEATGEVIGETYDEGVLQEVVETEASYLSVYQSPNGGTTLVLENIETEEEFEIEFKNGVSVQSAQFITDSIVTVVTSAGAMEFTNDAMVLVDEDASLNDFVETPGDYADALDVMESSENLLSFEDYYPEVIVKEMSLENGVVTNNNVGSLMSMFGIAPEDADNYSIKINQETRTAVGTLEVLLYDKQTQTYLEQTKSFYMVFNTTRDAEGKAVIEIEELYPIETTELVKNFGIGSIQENYWFRISVSENQDVYTNPFSVISDAEGQTVTHPDNLGDFNYLVVNTQEYTVGTEDTQIFLGEVVDVNGNHYAAAIKINVGDRSTGIIVNVIENVGVTLNYSYMQNGALWVDLQDDNGDIITLAVNDNAEFVRANSEQYLPQGLVINNQSNITNFSPANQNFDGSEVAEDVFNPDQQNLVIGETYQYGILTQIEQSNDSFLAFYNNDGETTLLFIDVKTGITINLTLADGVTFSEFITDKVASFSSATGNIEIAYDAIALDPTLIASGDVLGNYIVNAEDFTEIAGNMAHSSELIALETLAGYFGDTNINSLRFSEGAFIEGNYDSILELLGINENYIGRYLVLQEETADSISCGEGLEARHYRFSIYDAESQTFINISEEVIVIVQENSEGGFDLVSAHSGENMTLVESPIATETAGYSFYFKQPDAEIMLPGFERYTHIYTLPFSITATGNQEEAIGNIAYVILDEYKYEDDGITYQGGSCVTLDGEEFPMLIRTENGEQEYTVVQNAGVTGTSFSTYDLDAYDIEAFTGAFPEDLEGEIEVPVFYIQEGEGRDRYAIRIIFYEGTEYIYPVGSDEHLSLSQDLTNLTKIYISLETGEAIEEDSQSQ